MTVRVGRITSGMTAEDHRLAAQVHMAHAAGAPLRTMPGVASGLAMTKTSGLSAKIGPGQAWVPGSSATNQGGYPVTVDADEAFTFDPGDSTRNRIDRVVLRVFDNPYDTSGSQSGAVAVVKGAYPVSGSPVAPAVPANAVSLFLQPINAGTSVSGGGYDTTLTVDDRVRPSVVGGKVWCRNQAERDALDVWPGLAVFRGDLGCTETYDGVTPWWNDLPCYSRRVQTSGKNMVDGSWTTIDGWTNIEQANINYAAGVWTILYPGWYEASGQVAFDNLASPAGQRGGRLLLNGTIADVFQGARPDATYNTYCPVKFAWKAAAGDQLTIQGLSSQGTIVPTLGEDGATHFSIARTGRV